ncbi:MAG: zinc ribbon domain-containing protein, partial [Christensenellaceae bacterium]|nr:zinc ribbon domain-containing protein [Christensenellaceae bacterium]
MNLCKHCGAPLAPGARFCTGCGAAVLAEPACTCTNCGAQLPEGARFCLKCGTKVPAATPAPPKAPACPACGAVLEQDAKFCTKCGTATAPAAEAKPQPAAEAKPAPAPAPKAEAKPAPAPKAEAKPQPAPAPKAKKKGLGATGIVTIVAGSIAIIAGLLAVLFALTGISCVGGSAPAPTPQAAAANATDEAIMERLDGIELENTPEHVELVSDMMDDLYEDKLIKEPAEYVEETATFEFTYADGCEGILLLEPLGAEGDYDPSALEQWEWDEEDETTLSAAAPAHPHAATLAAGKPAATVTALTDASGGKKSKVLVLYATGSPIIEDVASNSYENYAERWHRAFFMKYAETWDSDFADVTIIEEVTVDDYRTFEEYDYILSYAHGKMYRDGAIFALDEVCTPEKDAAYKKDLLEDHDVIKIVSGGKIFYGIKSSFFEEEYPAGSLQGKTIFLTSCQLFGRDALFDKSIDTRYGDVFIKASADAVIGFHNSVLRIYAAKLADCFLHKVLEEGYSPAHALSYAKRIVGADDSQEEDAAYSVLLTQDGVYKYPTAKDAKAARKAYKAFEKENRKSMVPDKYDKIADIYLADMNGDGVDEMIAVIGNVEGTAEDGDPVLYARVYTYRNDQVVEVGCTQTFPAGSSYNKNESALGFMESPEGGGYLLALTDEHNEVLRIAAIGFDGFTLYTEVEVDVWASYDENDTMAVKVVTLPTRLRSDAKYPTHPGFVKEGVYLTVYDSHCLTGLSHYESAAAALTDLLWDVGLSFTSDGVCHEYYDATVDILSFWKAHTLVEAGSAWTKDADGYFKWKFTLPKKPTLKTVG